MYALPRSVNRRLGGTFPSTWLNSLVELASRPTIISRTASKYFSLTLNSLSLASGSVEYSPIRSPRILRIHFSAREFAANGCCSSLLSNLSMKFSFSSSSANGLSGSCCRRNSFTVTRPICARYLHSSSRYSSSSCFVNAEGTKWLGPMESKPNFSSGCLSSLSVDSKYRIGSIIQTDNACVVSSRNSSTCARDSACAERFI